MIWSDESSKLKFFTKVVSLLCFWAVHEERIHRIGCWKKNLGLLEFNLYLHSFFWGIKSLNIGRLAQLVQSTCLTSRGSLVRIQYRPQQKSITLVVLFAFKGVCWSSSLLLNYHGFNDHSSCGYNIHRVLLCREMIGVAIVLRSTPSITNLSRISELR